MVEPSQRTVDHDIEASMDLFRRAQVGEVAPIEPRKPRRVLLVLDGSNQDEPARAFARHFTDRFHSRISVLDARETPAANELAERTAAELNAEALSKPSGESFQQILDGIEQSSCELAIVPCPYGRDLEAVGSDSTGTVIDVLLARSPVPLLVVRRPYVPEKEPFHRVFLVLIGENRAAPAAAAWATALVGVSGRFELMLVLEEEFYENVRELMQTVAPGVDVTPEALSHALEKTHVRLHRGLQKAAAQAGFRYGMHTLREDEPAAVGLDDESGHPLLVLPLERGDHASEGHVHERIRHTPNPVLVVPG